MDGQGGAREAPEGAGQGALDAHTALDRVSDAVLTLTWDYVIGYANAATARLLGRPAEELRGCSLRDLLPEAFGAAFDVGQGTADAPPAPVQADVYLDSLASWFSVRTFPAPDGITVIARDTTAEMAARLSLVASERRYRMLAENATDVVYRMSPDGIIEFSSDGVRQILGLPPEHAIGVPAVDLIHPDDRDRAAAHLRQAMAGDRTPIRVRMLDCDGNGHWVEVSGHPVFEDGVFAGVVGGWRDIEEQVTAERAIARSEELYRLMAEHALDVVIRSETSGVISWVSPSVREILGWEPDELIGTPHADLLHPGDLASVLRLQAESVADGLDRAETEVRYRVKRGGWRWVRARGAVMRDAAGALVGGIDTLRDIDSEVEARSRLAFQVDHDALTGLGNRARTLALLEGPRRNGRTCALLCIGIDDLREINSAFTHTAGDRVLVAVARRLVVAAGNGNQVGRTGDNEFAVVVQDASPDSTLLSLVTSLQAAASGPVRLGQEEISVTVSIGVALGEGRPSLDLLRDASTAMRQARASGGNRWEYADAHVAEQARNRLLLQSGLRDALAAGRIQAWYQPIVSLPDGTVRGFEALARWVEPDGSVVAPDAFIPVAERTDLIVDLDRAILRQALSTARSLPPALHVAVNLSAGSLARQDLVDFVTAELAAASVNPRRLHLEVTETSLVSVTGAIRRRMQVLAHRGITWWVDDFGTGYSSLSHLRDMPVQGLKMDRSFTAGIADGDDPTHLRLAQGLIGLARGLGLHTVAEGVETPQQADLLAAQGWHYAQGWHFGRPTARPAAVTQPASLAAASASVTAIVAPRS